MLAGIPDLKTGIGELLRQAVDPFSGLSLANFVIVIYAAGNGDLGQGFGQNCNSSPFGPECAPNDNTCDSAALEIACNQI
ncbi:hypothetical protein RhiirA5_417902 [Rhizophagus irregularis]|uniref:Uncharacterized protein n=1 Tax=Rhizophagus irregularis TaxID=588596 RepID=A0A2I1E0V9_9GLOM|nr:hypothetical protein RhiirA5_417902 [Rhizophagus irregularis]PKC74718.1 hypothetical protein RhiirA1_449651 [Rhizophagus irregularis]PKY15759.1 hypothetical protein RhiirB3_428009 [Rhizophagus irregularis]CAB5365732.1 unnamed protein product [Rhizophagus irregularis]